MKSVFIFNEHLLKYTVLNSPFTLPIFKHFFIVFLSQIISFLFQIIIQLHCFYQTDTITEKHKQSKI